MGFVGRFEELDLLESKLNSKSSELVVLYGRRRVGKSSLIENLLNKRQNTFLFEGIEGANTKQQISKFVNSLQEQFKDPLLDDINFKSWDIVFSYLSQHVFNNKDRKIVFFDEFQWMAAQRKHLVGLIKYYWDNHWKKQNVVLILCGSVASFMVDQVIHSSALYGRIGLELRLAPLKPNESKLLFKKKRDEEEILKYLLVFGGIPKYLEEIDLKKSFRQNMNALCFSASSSLLNEIDKVFYNQFRETEVYENIVQLLKDKAYTLSQLAKRLKTKPGGSFQRYLRNLESAAIISSFLPIDAPLNSKLKKYKLTDEFLIFYFKYIKPNLKTIQKSKSKRLFEELVESQWNSWLGFAFERFCNKYANYFAGLMGFKEEVSDYGPLYSRDDTSFQIDLIYRRFDKVIVICEVKYHNQAIDSSVIAEMEKKIKLYKKPRGYSVEKALITVNDADKAVHDSEYFDYILKLEDIL